MRNTETLKLDNMSPSNQYKTKLLTGVDLKHGHEYFWENFSTFNSRMQENKKLSVSLTKTGDKSSQK